MNTGMSGMNGDGSNECPQKYFGRYRATVINNVDPMRMGRVQVIVPDVSNVIPSTWAMPSSPVGGLQTGMYAVPTIGVLASWAVLGERPNARDVVGGAMILGAVWVAEHGRGGRDVAPA